MMAKKTELDYPEVMEKNLVLTLEDWTNIFKDWNGIQKDTVAGTLIKIRVDAGYVTFSSSYDTSEMKLWLNLRLPKDPSLLNVSPKETT